jgi:hypothetical protein
MSGFNGYNTIAERADAGYIKDLGGIDYTEVGKTTVSYLFHLGWQRDHIQNSPFTGLIFVEPAFLQLQI